MPNDDVAVFTSVLQALEDVGILSDVVIIGGWAQHLYRRYFHDPPELSAMRTVDIDILFRRPPAIRPLGSLDESLKAAGFEREIAGDGSTKFTSREAEVEFLIPDKGRGDTGPYRIRELSIGAQSLRHLDMLTVDTIEVRYGRHLVKVPDPEVAAGLVDEKGRLLKKPNAEVLPEPRTPKKGNGTPQHRESLFTAVYAALPSGRVGEGSRPAPSS